MVDVRHTRHFAWIATRSTLPESAPYRSSPGESSVPLLFKPVRTARSFSRQRRAIEPVRPQFRLVSERLIVASKQRLIGHFLEPWVGSNGASRSLASSSLNHGHTFGKRHPGTDPQTPIPLGAIMNQERLLVLYLVPCQDYSRRIPNITGMRIT